MSRWKTLIGVRALSTVLVNYGGKNLGPWKYRLSVLSSFPLWLNGMGSVDQEASIQTILEEILISAQSSYIVKYTKRCTLFAIQIL